MKKSLLTPVPEYQLYLLLCEGGVIYTGITNDFERRYTQHCAGVGAKFTRGHPPTRLVALATIGSRSDALKLEYAVKQLPRNRKIDFVNALTGI